MNNKHRCSLGAIIAAICFIFAIALMMQIALFAREGTTMPPNATSSKIEQTTDELTQDIDWDYWKSINPDVVGWISIPGTKISCPLVQAHKDDPDYYLSHDVYQNYNLFGAIYIDADDEDKGLDSPNVVILGHDIQGLPDVSFGVLPNYTDLDFARDHNTIDVISPDTSYVLSPRYVNIVPGWMPSKKTEFSDTADYRDWYIQNRADADTVIDTTDFVPNKTFSLVTCSYFIWQDNERCVVTCN